MNTADIHVSASRPLTRVVCALPQGLGSQVLRELERGPQSPKGKKRERWLKYSPSGVNYDE